MEILRGVLHIPLEITEEHRANLQKLGDYLTALPEGYDAFTMDVFMDNSTSGIGDTYAQKFEHRCGTIGCAAGHGPNAGIEPLLGEKWNDYVYRCFGVASYGPAWEFLFDSEWTDVDNTPQGAGTRILYALKHGIPETYGEWSLI